MTRSSLISSWFIGIITVVLAVESQQYSDIAWAIIAFIGFAICRQLRTGAPKITEKFEHPFKTHPVFSVFYYFSLLFITMYTLLNKQEIIDIGSTFSFFVLFLLLCFPLVPVFIKYEAYLYEISSKKPNN